MNVLLTNDDGIHAPGLDALYQALSARHHVIAAAPETEQSAVGHAITLSDPIQVKPVFKNGAFFGNALSGTPADCVRIGVAELADAPVDVVVSGVNRGSNVGINILYSGTVSAATEAALLGLPGLAVSLDAHQDPDFEPAARIALAVLEQMPHWNLPRGVALNLNVPGVPFEAVRGVRWAAQSLRANGEKFTKRLDPRGNTYYWRGLEILPEPAGDDTDFDMLNQGFAVLTPLTYDLTAHGVLSGCRDRKIDL